MRRVFACVEVSIGAKRSAINTSNVPPRDDCSSRPAAVPVLTFRPAARPRWPRGRQLGTTHAQQRTGTASVSRSGASGGSVYAAARCASTARFVIRHLRPKRPVRGSSGFAAPARSGIRAGLAATDDPYRWRGAGGPNARCGLVSPLAAAAADRLRTTVTLNTPGAPIDKLHDTLHRCQRLVDKGVHSHRSTCTCVVVFR